MEASDLATASNGLEYLPAFLTSLSIGLFAFLMVMIAFGIIEPHGIYPDTPASDAPHN